MNLKKLVFEDVTNLFLNDFLSEFIVPVIEYRGIKSIYSDGDGDVDIYTTFELASFNGFTNRVEFIKCIESLKYKIESYIDNFIFQNRILIEDEWFHEVDRLFDKIRLLYKLETNIEGDIVNEFLSNACLLNIGYKSYRNEMYNSEVSTMLSIGKARAALQKELNSYANIVYNFIGWLKAHLKVVFINLDKIKANIELDIKNKKMALKDFLDIEKLLIDDKIEECLKLMLKEFEHINSIKNELILFGNRHTKNEAAYHKHTKQQSDYELEHNKIVDGLIRILSNFKNST